MSNAIANWWRSYQFHTAIKKGNLRRAEELLQEIQKSGARLSSLEKLFKDKLQLEQTTRDYRQQISAQYRQLSQLRQQLEQIEPSQALGEISTDILTPEPEFIEFVSKNFKFVEHDENMLQCTGIDRRVFDDFEESLADFIKEEFSQQSRKKNFHFLLDDAINDINRLKGGQDPQYRFELSPHIYLMRYFLDNVYCAYLAWFLIYKAGLLPSKINILDIAAGPGTIAYGLALLLQSSNSFLPAPPTHVSYYSLEQQKNFQYRGLQFWRKYIEPQETATNAYFRFDTSSIFDYDNQSARIPLNFFNLIVISHCFFSDSEARDKSIAVYNDIFTNCLQENGHVLLIIQGKKLFKAYGIRQSESLTQEESVVKKFVEELGLNLVWYKYLTSTYRREPIPDFGIFARENLPTQKFMSPLFRQYFKLNFDLNYGLDDYVILAKK
ncbi:photosystem II assembly protein [Aerosakkonema funiforme]|uniref:Photosystem II assembly protein n=1 Tax=Aerosakkonema funiforme FACHB-1375 TaxID=2949571 RepID=A0A926VAS2_9CYAN|nr:photosystem II assembly protein [Aerosakkonema funiforme]MBD2180403.1 photosystem II assembly protein [Aerosakkonema funiforme FACHB-1375]